ncbi:helix-turn-helix domain-containing protein [Floricoccus penangensis]|uniref:helix-turn-helix domain-containing protein n=1 Tax=Floricoccus penangensis TaxID=1859475 RepID=UPI00203FE262|nr:Rgg/GadR/MutR family transcriptional regulator [Floricoccus penangensis]URZ87029.1 helix-turn-helix domain-containing protein [Floricoccus penangensis]
MKMTNEELGLFFREIRKARKLTLNDVASDTVTAAQLSKFERGESALSFDRLFSVINALNMSIEEFAYAMNGYELNDFQTFISKLDDAQGRKNDNYLLQLREKYSSIETPTTDERMKKILIDTYLRNLNRFIGSEYKVSKEDADFVADYLMSVDIWTNYEVLLLNQIMYFINIETINTLAKDMIFRDTYYQDIHENKEAIFSCLCNIYCMMIINKDNSYHFYRKKIEEILSSSSESEFISCKIFFDFATCMEDYIINQSLQALEEMEKIISGVKILKLNGTSSHLQFEYDLILKKYPLKEQINEDDE